MASFSACVLMLWFLSVTAAALRDVDPTLLSSCTGGEMSNDTCWHTEPQESAPPLLDASSSALLQLAETDLVYARSVVGAPWGVATNEMALDVAFNGSWREVFYEHVDASALLAGDTCVVVLEGSDSNADELGRFLADNRAAIENFVLKGGVVFVNAAPNEGGDIDLPFGAQLRYPEYVDQAEACVGQESHPIFANVATSYTGFFFAHGYIDNGGDALICASNDDRPLLSISSHGRGTIVYGTLTTTNFHGPQPDAFELRTNIYRYLGSLCGIKCDCFSTPSSPVCGADGHTYDNACLARCDGVWSCAGSCPQACAENPPAGWDYFSCSKLPHFWEAIADDYHVDTCRIGFNITERQWYIDDEPACVAWGEYSESCNDDYFCAGVDGTTVGYSFQQMETIASMLAGDFQVHSLCPVCPLTMPGHIDICNNGELHSIPIYDQLPSDFGTPGSLAFQGRGTWLACDCTEVHIGHSLPAGSYWFNLAESYGLDGDLVSHYNDVWYYNGKYSCVAMGQHADSCDNTVFHCSGINGDHFGYAGQQMAALKSSSHFPSGVHADCPLR